MMQRWSDQPFRLLFSWARWLRVKHPTTSLVNLGVPVVSFGLWLAFLWTAPQFNFVGDLGLVVQTNGLLQALAPFFVAALALVAGFPGEALDKPMGGLQPYLLMADDKYYPSRRQLLGYLFAYLAGLSLLTYMVGAFMVAATHPYSLRAIRWFSTGQHGYVASLLKALYGAILIHLFAVTLLGLHFLGNFMSASGLSRASPSPSPNVSPPSNLITESSSRRRTSTPQPPPKMRSRAGR